MSLGETPRGGAGPYVRRLFHLLPLGVSLAACDPAPKNAGEVPGTSGTDSADDATSSGSDDSGDMTEPGIEASLELGTEVGIFELEPAADGGVVAVLVADPPASHVTVVGISADMAEQWTIDLPDTNVQDLARLDDGTYVMAGSSGATESPVPTAWRLSCCGEILQTQTFPVTMPLAYMAVGQPIGDGLLLVYSGVEASGVIRTSMDMVEQWSVDSLPFRTYNGAPTAAGTVLLSGAEGVGSPLLFEILPDAPGLGLSDGQTRGLVGKGANLVMMTPGFGQVWFEPQAGGAVVAVPIPGFEVGSYAAARRERFGFAHTIDDETSSITHVLEFDADGTVYRDVPVPSMSADYVSPTAIEVATDDAIFVGVLENGPGQPGVARLHRLAPL